MFAGNYIELKTLICLLIEKYGLPMAKKVAIRELRRMGEMGLIEIDRSPPVTRTGKKAYCRKI